MRIFILPVLFAASAASPQTRDTSLALIPQPRQVARVRDITLKRGVTIELPANGEDRFAARDLGDELKARGVRVVYDGSGSARLEFARMGTAHAKAVLAKAKIVWTEPMNAEGYAIVSSGTRLVVIARTAPGVF